jgi:hypothetical protein
MKTWLPLLARGMSFVITPSRQSKAARVLAGGVPASLATYPVLDQAMPFEKLSTKTRSSAIGFTRTVTSPPQMGTPESPVSEHGGEAAWACAKDMNK